MKSTTNTELNVPYIEKDRAKKLGARWNGKSWYVPAGLSLEPFQRWLPPRLQQISGTTPPGSAPDPSSPSSPLQVFEPPTNALGLGEYLRFVEQAVQQVPGAQWVAAEITELHEKNGHIYLALVEQTGGNTVARCRATIWRSQGRLIKKRFEQVTGGPLTEHIKILMLVDAQFHPLHGFNLNIRDIDPAYTMGDLAAKIRAIMDALDRRGIAAQNKAYRPPLDYVRVAVLSPQQAAGLGDFRREADILQNHSVCRFDYYHGLFQGYQAAANLTAMMQRIFQKHEKNPYDVLVIIRGGGAVTDLAWLNDEALAQAVCTSPMPVFTGIGHERDRTVLDEVACLSFDTPSKVIQYIYTAVRAILEEARRNRESVERLAVHMVNRGDRMLHQQFQSMHRYSHWLLKNSYHRLGDHARRIHAGGQICDRARVQIRHLITGAQRDAGYSVVRVRRYGAQHLTGVAQRAGFLSRQAKFALGREWKLVGERTVSLLRHCRRHVNVEHRLIVGLDPKQILKRGFTLVRDEKGQVVARRHALTGDRFQVQFYDEQIWARIDEVDDEQGKK